MAVNRILEAIDFESNESNFKLDFKKMCQKYGKEFIPLLKAMWQANEGVQTEEDFCRMNGLPLEFFCKTIR
jgi:hypothetical protein